MILTNEETREKYGYIINDSAPNKELLGVAALYSAKLGELAEKIFTGTASKGGFSWKYPKNFKERNDFITSAKILKSRILGKFEDVSPREMDNIFRTYAP